jgi:hypothetical protein
MGWSKRLILLLPIAAVVNVLWSYQTHGSGRGGDRWHLTAPQPRRADAPLPGSCPPRGRVHPSIRETNRAAGDHSKWAQAVVVLLEPGD